MSRRTIAVEVTQPAADAFREVARILEDEITAFDPVALHKFALEMGVLIGPNLRQRLASKTRAFADIVEEGEF